MSVSIKLACDACGEAVDLTDDGWDGLTVLASDDGTSLAVDSGWLKVPGGFRVRGSPDSIEVRCPAHVDIVAPPSAAELATAAVETNAALVAQVCGADRGDGISCFRLPHGPREKHLGMRNGMVEGWW